MRRSVRKRKSVILEIIKMSWFDKTVIILGVVAMSLIFWHVFGPREWHIDGFFGVPLHLCSIIVGVAIGTPLTKIK